jgi:hypothetical protein
LDMTLSHESYTFELNLPDFPVVGQFSNLAKNIKELVGCGISRPSATKDHPFSCQFSNGLQILEILQFSADNL